MAAIKQGDKVRIKTREHTPKEIEQMTYFPHYGGLEGEVARVFEGGDVVVSIARESLPPDANKMHKHIETRVKDKFVANISEEGRKRLTKEELDVKLSYVVVVKQEDLEPIKGGTPAKPAAKAEPPAASEKPAKPAAAKAEPEPKRKTIKELEDEEAAYLRERQKKT